MHQRVHARRAHLALEVLQSAPLVPHAHQGALGQLWTQELVSAAVEAFLVLGVAR
jgi:hypothetical protein